MLNNSYKVNIKSAVILCGGKGTRLGFLSKKLPKSLVPVKNKPIIWYIIKMLKRNGFNHFILPIGYKGKSISEFIKKSKDLNNFNIQIVNTGVESSISNRILKIKNLIKSKNFLLLNGDAIFDFNIKKIFENHNKFKDRFITFLGTYATLPYGTIEVKTGKVTKFRRDLIYDTVISKNTRKKSINYIYSGMAIIRRNILQKKFINFKNFELSFYPSIIKKYKCKFVSISGFWYSIDSVKDLKQLNTSFSEIKLNQIKKKLL